MLSEVPNLALVFGYTNASWTLKSDLTCRYVCRLLRHMDRDGYASCTPRNRDHTLASEPFINLSSSSSFQRSRSSSPTRVPGARGGGIRNIFWTSSPLVRGRGHARQQ